MSLFRDRVYETSTTTGTGNFTLAGAVTGYRTFSAAFSTAAAYYMITNQSAAAEWEVGSFTVSGTTLARVAGNVLSGSAGAGTLVNFSAGTKNVYNIAPAAAMQAWIKTASGSFSEYGNLPRITSVSLSVTGGTNIAISAGTACNCNCCCNCGGCFPAGTKVLKNNGEWCNIEELKKGDFVLGLNNSSCEVLGLHKPLLGAHRNLLEINNEFFTTSDHLLLTDSGWGAVSPQSYKNLRHDSMLYFQEMNMFAQSIIQPEFLVTINEGTELATVNGLKKIEQIRSHEASSNLQLYSPILNGSQSFVLQGGYIADGCMGRHIEVEKLTTRNEFILEAMNNPEANV